MNYEHHYTRFPTLRAYIDRVGAEQLNFRRFMVKEFHGHYYVEKVLIKINDDFSIDCRDERYLPTEAEAVAIIAELATANFPKHVRATLNQVEELRKSGLIEGMLFAFPDVTRKGVVMCQERREKKEDTGKYYIPWSMYAEEGQKGEWVSMEPDGALPFWKPLGKRNKSIIMVHEGAKTAAFVDGLLNDRTRMDEKKDYARKAPEWMERLEACEHWGAIGGALAMHRCDFKELHDMKIESHLIYSCDNDTAGVEAAKTFSRNMSGKEVRVIRYNNTFPPGWDLADPLPDGLFDKRGRVKLTLDALCQPATWATSIPKKEKGSGPGRPSAVLTNKFKEEWYHCTDVGMFYHASMPGYSFDEKAFNNFVRPFSDVDDTARLVRTNLTGKAAFPSYDPGKEYGPYNKGVGKNLFFNTYVAQPFREYSVGEAKRLDHSLLEKFFEHLIPDEGDRHETIKWCATLCACPSIKMDYGLLAVSEPQGVGKSTLGEILKGVVGEHNTSQPNERSINEERNSWAAHKRLAIIPEIYQGHSQATYNLLKSLITEKTIWVNQKYVVEYQVPNCVHIYANSNSAAPLRFDQSDRRWFVPRITEDKVAPQFWMNLYDDMENNDGYRKAWQFFRDFVKKHGHVIPGAEAPDSSAKREMIIDQYSPGQEKVQRALEFIANPRSEDDENGKTKINGQQAEMARIREAFMRKVPIFVLDKDGVDGISRVVEDRRGIERIAQPAAAIRKVARVVGFHVGNDRNKNPRLSLNARVLSRDEDLTKTPIIELLRMLEEAEPRVVYAQLGLIMEEREAL